MKIKFKDLSKKYQTKIKNLLPSKLTSKKNKFNATKITINNYKFDSKKESNRYLELLLLKKNNKIKYFIRQPIFDIGSGVIYKADFLIVELDNSIKIEDVKGFQTKTFKLKKKFVEDLYKIKINLLF